MTVPAIDDPFEREHLLVRDAPVLAFAPRAFEVSSDELVRWVGLDLAAGVPHEVGDVSERFPAGRGGEVQYHVRFFELGTSLALATEIDEPAGAHRVLEVLGVKGDVRARVNLTRVRALEPVRAGTGPSDEAREVALGNVRVWGGEPGEAERAVATIHRHLRLLGLEPGPHEGGEPTFKPPAADRLACELPGSDAAVLAALIELLVQHPAEGARPRHPRRLSLLEDRVKRAEGGTIAYRFEHHRAGTGVLHFRRREVEAGPERPALVRTWNVIGLRGGARVRVREVGGRATLELGGSRDGVAAAMRHLKERLGVRS